jgi:VanZ family protein
LSSERLSPFRAWWPVAVWVGLISIESTTYLSSENTGRALYALVVRLFGKVDLQQFEVWHHYLRKTGHVIGYGMLSLLLLRGLRATFAAVSEIFNLRAAAIAWIGTVFVASLDEWHQSYIPSRTGTPWDVVLDSSAALVFLVLAYLWFRQSRPAVRKIVAESG